MKTLFFLYFLSFSLLVFAHEGHDEMKMHSSENIETVDGFFQQQRPTSWTQWIGSFHFMLLHFPIALIYMLAISELLFSWYKKPIFEYSSKFLLISAAVFAPPTAILGWIYSYSASYEGIMGTFLMWHMWFGILTAVLVVFLVFIKEKSGFSKMYYICLSVLFLFVNITGFFGGGMTLGLTQMLPPFLL